MSRNYIVRPYQLGNEAKIIEVMETVFHGWPHFDLQCPPIDHWKWKYVDNPQGTGKIAVAETENRIIGCFHLYINRVKVGSNVYPCIQSADTVVHPDFQGLGIYTKLYGMTDELIDKTNIGLHYGVTANPVIYKTMKKIETINIQKPITKLVRIRDVNLIIKKDGFTRASLIYAAKTLNTLQHLSKRSPKATEKKFEITEVKRFDERIDEFWEEIKDDYNFITEAKHEYLNWRYCDPRGGKYVVKMAEEEGKIIGYIALRTDYYDKDSPIGYVVSLCTLSDRLDCARSLTDESISFFDDLGINIVNYCTFPGHPYEVLFKERDFLDSRTSIFLTLRPKIIGSEFLDFKNSPPNKMLFQYGDFDWI